jgi:hypothetical protein
MLRSIIAASSLAQQQLIVPGRDACRQAGDNQVRFHILDQWQGIRVVAQENCRAFKIDSGNDDLAGNHVDENLVDERFVFTSLGVGH